jgi:threonine/homoserine/homoserine lactone efflux protein
MTDLIALALATAILVMIPGPNVALIVANSLRYGLREGAVTVFGTTLGVALQLVLVVIGVAAVIEFAAEALRWIRWGGVVYLLYLGIHAWREPASSLDAIEAQPTVFWRACVVAAINPKTLLFNAAFLPQFLPGGAGKLELMLTVGVFLSVLFVGDMLWATFANSARRLLQRYGRFRNRLTGAFLVAAGIGLAMSRRNL